MTAQLRSARHALWYWGPVVLCMAVIFTGSSMSTLPSVASEFPDKVEHWAEYAVLGLLLARALGGARWLSLTWPYAAGAVAVAALYGVSDEFHQLFVPGRDFDVRDMLADAAGASTSVGALWAWGIIKRFSAVSNARQGPRPTTDDHAVRPPAPRP